MVHTDHHPTPSKATKFSFHYYILFTYDRYQPSELRWNHPGDAFLCHFRKIIFTSNNPYFRIRATCPSLHLIILTILGKAQQLYLSLSCHFPYPERIWILTAVFLKTQIFVNVRSCRLENSYRSSETS